MSFDWLPTLLAAAGTAPDASYPSDGEDILPVLLGERPRHDRTLFWRYKAQRQRALRDGRWKYLKINEHEFLFDDEADQRERANLKDRYRDVFERLRTRWLEWDATFLPITDDVYTHGVTPDAQADHYVPDPPVGGPAPTSE
jgi:arylsulfatase A-like enzyme